LNSPDRFWISIIQYNDEFIVRSLLNHCLGKLKGISAYATKAAS
jgi:hypothetical protein